MVADRSTDTSERTAESEPQSAAPTELVTEAPGATPLALTGYGLPPGLPVHPTNQGLRQQALLQLQRSHGNAHVQELLAQPANGTHALDLQPAPAESALQRQDDFVGPERSQEEKEVQWNIRKTDVNSHMLKALLRSERSKGSWDKYTNALGSAYTEAYKNHTTACAAQSKFDALVASAVVGVFVAVAGVGVTAHFKKGVEVLSLQAQAMVASINSAMGSIAKGVTKPATVSPVGLEPQQFENEAEDKVTDARDTVLAPLEQLMGAIAGADLSLFEEVNPEGLAAAFDVVMSHDLMQDAPTPPDDLAIELEKAIWSRWLTTGGLPEVVYVAPEGMNAATRERPGHIIEARLVACGLVGEDFFGGWFTSDEDEADLLVTIAEGTDQRLEQKAAKEEAEAEKEAEAAGAAGDGAVPAAGGEGESPPSNGETAPSGPPGGGDLDEGTDPYTGPPEEEAPVGDFEM